MSKAFTNTDQYAADLSQLWSMISDKSYWEAKYDAAGAENLTWHEFDANDESLTISSTRDVIASVPGFAKKVIGETAAVTQTENWTREEGRLSCEIQIATKGAPGGTTGTMIVEPKGNGCAWRADFQIKVSIPFVGGKLEGLMLEQTESSFASEKQFNDQWLAERA